MEALSVFSLWLIPLSAFHHKALRSLREEAYLCFLWSRPRSLSKCMCESVRCHSPSLQTTGWITREDLCYSASKLTPSQLSIIHYPCNSLLRLHLHLHFSVIIHIVRKPHLLNLSLNVLKLPYLFIPTYHFSLYVSVDLQSLPFIYCIPHPHPSVHEALVLFLIRWLAHCRLQAPSTR